MVAYVFPGQNSQYAGMGKKLAQESSTAADVFAEIDGAVDLPLTEIMFGGDDDALQPTHIQQPAIFAHSVGVFCVVNEKIDCRPEMVAGHSLGEYSALVAAECMNLQDAAALVAERGRLMEKAAAESGGAMAAIIKLDHDAVNEIVKKAGADRTLAIANYNNPDQTVISGEGGAVDEACTLARQRGGRGIPLDVSGAFHSPLMQQAAEQFRPHLIAAQMQNARIPVVSNVDAVPHTEVSEIKDGLAKQVTHPVRWQQTVRVMIENGIDIFVELGPGAVLTNTIKRIDDDVTTLSVTEMADVEALADHMQ